MGKAKYKMATTLEEWTKIQSLGTYEDKFKNGEIWSFNGELWYLSHLELPFNVLAEVVDFYDNYNI